MQVEPGKPGGCFGPYNARKGGQPVRCPNRVFCVNEPSAVPWRRCGDLFWCGWLRGEMKQCGWLWGDVRWGNVVGCEMSRQCHVMWCHVIWCDVIPCVVLCHVMQCDVMWCALMWWDVICCEVTRRNGTGSSQFVMRCGWLRCHVVWFEVAVWCRELEDDLVRTTKKYKYCTAHSSTKYYSVLHSTTNYDSVLLCTTLCTVLQSVLQSTTTYYKVLLTPYYKVWLRTTKYYKDTTPYDKASICLIDATHETPSTLREATGVTFELHQSLRLPRKMILMIDPRDISNVIYIAQSSTSHPPTSPNIAPATKNDSHDWSSSPMKSHLHCAEHQDSPFQHHQILCLPRKMTLMIDPAHIWTVNKQCVEHQETPSNITEYCACHEKWLMIDPAHIWNVICNARSNVTFQNMKKICWMKTDEASFTMADNARMIRAWSEHELAISHPPLRRAYFSRFGDAFCMCSGYLPTFRQMLRLPRKFTLQHHQMLRLLWKVRLQRHRIFCLPPKTTLMIDPPQIWNGIYIGRSNSLQRHQILRLPRKWHSKSPKFMKKTCWKRMKRHLQFTMADNARLIWAWSEHELWSSRSHRSPSLLFTLWRRSLYRKMRHFVLRLSTVISPNAAPARKSDTPTSPNVAPAARSATATSPNATTKSETPTSPNTAPATKNDSHDWSYYDKWDVQCAMADVSDVTDVTWLNCYWTVTWENRDRTEQ